jgi:hypothetical protein
MRSRLPNLTAILIMTMASTVFANPKPQTYTGEVSDSMCGAKHMTSNHAECTHACLKQGSKYALVVGDKVYTLQADEKDLATLDRLAGEKAKVTGTLDGDTLKVNSVAASQ